MTNEFLLPSPSPDFADCVRRSLKNQRHRAFPLVWEGKTLWIKQAIPSKENFFHKVQKVISSLFSWYIPLLKPTVCLGGAEALREEAYRLKKWQKAGIKVPEVMAFEGPWMALTHQGVALSFVLENHRHAHPEKDLDRLNLVMRAAQEVIHVHKLGFCLGSGRLRDIVYDGVDFYFIDGEEDPSQVMSLEAAQARDLLFFILTSLRHLSQDSQIILPIWKFFLKESTPLVLKNIQRLKPFLKILLFIRYLPRSWIGRDLKEAIIWAQMVTEA